MSSDENLAATLFITLSCLVVGLATVAGVTSIGSPGKARAQSLDAQRIQALGQLSSAVESYHSDKAALPVSLAIAAAEEDWITPASLRDPVSGAAYQYRITGPASFELCASFALPSQEDEAIRWRHGAGLTCFSSQVKPPPLPRGEAGPIA